VEAIATSRGITVLTSDAEKYGLSWLTDDGAPKQYALSSSPVGGPSLHAFESEVAIAFSEQGVFFAQTFDEDGPLRGRIGLPNISNIALIDYGFLWHTHLINELTPRFMRSTWFPTKL
jgi:hypothetical protein